MSNRTRHPEYSHLYVRINADGSECYELQWRKDGRVRWTTLGSDVGCALRTRDDWLRHSIPPLETAPITARCQGCNRVRLVYSALAMQCRSCGQMDRGRLGRTLYNRSWLHARYWNDGLSTVQIAATLGTSKSTVLKWMKRLDIPSRSRSEANRLASSTRSEMENYGRNRRMVTAGAKDVSGVYALGAGAGSKLGR